MISDLARATNETCSGKVGSQLPTLNRTASSRCSFPVSVLYCSHVLHYSANCKSCPPAVPAHGALKIFLVRIIIIMIQSILRASSGGDAQSNLNI